MRVLRGVVYIRNSKGPRTALENTTGGSMQGQEVIVTFNMKGAR